MSVSRTALTGSLLLFCCLALAADDEIPDMEFLEYLGSWEESDEDWLILAEATEPVADKRSDPAPEGEESAEKDDEG